MLNFYFPFLHNLKSRCLDMFFDFCYHKPGTPRKLHFYSSTVVVTIHNSGSEFHSLFKHSRYFRMIQGAGRMSSNISVRLLELPSFD